MLTAVWCVFSCIGAWLTLRHMPFYTAKSALRTLGLTLLMIGAVAGVIGLTARGVDGRSLAVQTTVLVSVVILCTLGLILGVSAVSTPSAARLTTHLPPDVAAVTVYRRRILPWARLWAQVLGGSLLLMLVPGAVRYIAGSFAIIVAALGVIMLPVGYLTARRVDRAVTALQLNPWVHWHYPPAAWNAWSEHLATVEAKTRAVATRMRAAPPDTYFGHDGVFCNGEFCAWRGADVSLLSAAVEPGPPRCLELWFEKFLPGSYGGAQVTKVRQQVLIAEDAAAADLPALQSALVARCPDARINLT